MSRLGASLDLSAVSILSSSEVRIDGNTFSSTFYGIRAGTASRRLTIVDNTFIASQTQIGGRFGVLFEDVSEASAIERNSFDGYQTAVQVRAAGRGLVHILQNVVRREPPPPGVLEESDGFAIEVAAPDCLVRDNSIEIVAPEHGGILAQGDRACVEENSIRAGASAETEGRSNLVGIAVRPASNGTSPQDPIVSANRLQVAEAGSLLTAILVEDSDNARVVGNEIVGNDLEAEAPTRLQNGLQLVNVRGSFAQSNRIVNATDAIFAGKSSSCCLLENTVERAAGAGIRLNIVTGTTQIAHNRLLFCGFKRSEEPAAALFVSDARGELDLESNEIIDSGLDGRGGFFGSVVHGIALGETPYLRVHGNLIRYSESLERMGIDPNLEHRALFVRVSNGDTEGVAANAQVLDNKFIGPGLSHLIELQRIDDNLGFENVVFSNNYCDHFNSERGGLSTVTLWTRSPQQGRGSLVVVGNQITNRGGIPAMDLNGLQRPTVVANSVRGDITGPNSEVPNPYTSFNVIYF